MKKIYLGIVFTVVMSLFFVGWVIDQFAESNMDEKDSESAIYDSMMMSVAHGLTHVQVSDFNQYLTKISTDTGLDFTLEQSDSIALPSSLLDKLNEQDVLSLQTEKSIFYLYKLPKYPHLLLSLTVTHDATEANSVNLVLTLALYIGISIALIAWLLPLTRRLSTLDATADAFGKGQLDSRIKPVSWSYISSLENNFNRMATQIEKLVADNKMLAGSLSHDLRTPLSCLRFGIEAAKDCESIDEQSIIFHRLDDELTRMEAMLDAFLNYASMERQGIKLNATPTNIAELVHDLKDEQQAIAGANNINIKTTCDVLHPVSLDRHWIGRALMNLISNAIDYAKSEIIIEANVHDGQLLIKVSDDGIGIDETALKSIFEPFTKGDSARDRSKNQFGLGLAIVKRVVEWHDGKVRASNLPERQGACFCLHIPTEKQKSS
ncbi:HAMP domain-containing sensor histidine kinase [Agaribacter marinus]|uniref:histidine kinase n=1 Tax=Agaribacter marinus TaxID=1431249 RepID=A0AA37SYK7_9ALTE|nr:ATP-binding protein [Agaribacter marinus]GLR70994.1 two-component sensor histidine kinase [Agaribacter marinus]